MIGCITSPYISVIFRLIVLVLGRKRAETYWRKKLILYNFQDRLPFIFGKNRILQRNRNDLVGANRRVIFRIDQTAFTFCWRIHNIEQATYCGIPKSRLKTFMG